MKPPQPCRHTLPGQMCDYGHPCTGLLSDSIDQIEQDCYEPGYFRFLFRKKGDWRFKEGTYFDSEEEAIKGCERESSRHPEKECGYVVIGDPNVES